MKKQIKKKSEALITPLRLTADEAAALQQLQEYLNETTRNGTVVTAIINFQELSDQRNRFLDDLAALKEKIKSLQKYFLMMDEAESEIKKILKSN